MNNWPRQPKKACIFYLTLSEYHTAYSIVARQFYFGINELSPSVDSG